jgi:hypothetical protein
MGFYIDGEQITGGASNSGDESGHDGISQAAAATLADKIIAEERKLGDAREAPKRGSRRNNHLNGYGDPRSPANGES